MNKIELKHLASYEEDFALWATEQAALLRASRPDRVDLENVAEEIEGLWRGNKHEIQSRMTIILIQLLKWMCRPSGRTPSWASSIALNLCPFSAEQVLDEDYWPEAKP